MVDNIEPPALLITLTLIVAAWLALGIRDRRRARRDNVRVAVTRAAHALADRACGLVWCEGETWCVCTRRFEHAGPCLDSLHNVIHRDRPFINLDWS